jgi:hypothetical protein
MPANPYEVPLKSGDGLPFFVAPHPVLAVGKVHHVGEAVAVVVAEPRTRTTGEGWGRYVRDWRPSMQAGSPGH